MERRVGSGVLVGVGGSRLRPLPDWMAHYGALGQAIGQIPSSTPGTVVVLSATRVFGALTAAFGVVHARRKLTVVTASQFNEVWDSQRDDIDVRYTWRGKEIRGRVVGRETRNGVKYLRLTPSGRRSGSDFLPEQAAHNLAILEQGASHRMRALGFTDPWLKQMLHGCDEDAYLLANRYDCLIIGQDAHLSEEAELEVHVNIDDDSRQRKFLGGTVRCALRVRRWQPTGTTFSCEVVPSSGDHEDYDVKDLRRFPVVIFDGGASYLRWSDSFYDQHHIVILQQSDSRLEEVAHRIDKEFLSRTEVAPIVPPAPRGMEQLVFGRFQ